MGLREAVRTALRGLRANRLRSALTMLGLVIGVAAVILLVAIGNGVQSAVNGPGRSESARRSGLLAARSSNSSSAVTRPTEPPGYDRPMPSGTSKCCPVLAGSKYRYQPGPGGALRHITPRA